MRVGDVLEYSFTWQGRNPVFQGRFYDFLRTRRSVPVDRVRHRLLWPRNRHLGLHNLNDNPTAETRIRGEVVEYRWALDRVPALLEDSATPLWFNPYSAIQLSETDQWAMVVQWALPLYRVPQTLSPELEALAERIGREHRGNGERVAAVLRFVQDQVRYMGIEIGPGSHAPTDPSVVLKRRFGDCKDKTLLALTLLDRLGVEAYPALVNTRRNKGLERYLPSPTVFNHVMLKVIHEGATYWLDPTLRLQRGRLGILHQPDYGAALVIIAPGTKGLERFPPPDAGRTTKLIADTYDLRDGIGEPARYTVLSVFTYGDADRMRRLFADTSMQELQKDYLNYYADKLPSIRPDGELELADFEEENRIVLTERYLIPDFWERDEQENLFKAHLNPHDIVAEVPTPSDVVRTMPYAITHPSNLRQTTRVLLPEEWGFEADHIVIEDPAFLFQDRY